VLRNRSLIRLSEWLEGLLYRSADCVVVNSPGYIDHVRSRGARTVHLIPNGVDLSMFDPAEDGGNFRRKYDLEDEFMMLYAGAHGISNDLGVVLEAAQLLRDHSDIAIVFLGNGKEKSTLMAKAEALELNNVRFIPSLPKIEMPIALAAADGCIAILKPIEAYKTTFPNKVFDYMAAGRPVVLAVDGVIRDVVEQAGAGVFVPPGDPKAMAEAIKRMADDRDTSAEMGRKGRAYVAENFDRLALSGSMMQVMEGLLGDRHSS
jgi:glycosyltransferase involved in cell wall biosynthesis